MTCHIPHKLTLFLVCQQTFSVRNPRYILSNIRGEGAGDIQIENLVLQLK